MDKLKITKPHRKGCDALAMVASGRWDHPWWYNTYLPVPHIALRGRRYIFLRCQDTQCHAQLRVSVSWIEDMIATEAPPPP